MVIAKINVDGVTAVATELRKIPKGITGATIEVTFGGAWDGLTKTAVFSGAVVKDVLGVGNVITVPAECVAVSGSRLRVGFYGVDADHTVIIPTLWADLGIVRAAADPSGDTSTNPALPVWAQLQDQIDDLKQNGGSTGGGGGADGFSPIAKVEQTDTGAVITITDKNGTTTATVVNGKDGKDGQPGEKGDPGEPGADGKDYVLTEADKAEIADMVEVPESGSGGGIDVTGAEVGQTIVVKAVDENGKPTEWECADFPEGGSGGGGATETLVASYTHSGNLEVVVSSIDYDTGTITAAGHGLSENDMIYATQNWGVDNLENPEKWLPTGMLYGSRYYAVNVTADTFQISTTKSGTVATLSTKGTADFSKWHFERDTDQWGSSIKLTNVGTLTSFAVRIFGKSLTTSAAFYVNTSVGHGYVTASPDGFNTFNTFVGVGLNQSGDILLNVKSKVQYDKTIGRYVLDREGFRVNNKKGSAYAVETTVLDTHGVSTKRSPIEVTSMTFWNCYPANGTIVEVYKL